jgi:hypothetical protein
VQLNRFGWHVDISPSCYLVVDSSRQTTTPAVAGPSRI